MTSSLQTATAGEGFSFSPAVRSAAVSHQKEKHQSVRGRSEHRVLVNVA